MSKKDKGIKSEQVTIDRFEGEVAIFESVLGNFELPKKLLPSDLKEGDAAVITIASHEEETKRREMRAKDLLNEILSV